MTKVYPSPAIAANIVCNRATTASLDDISVRITWLEPQDDRLVRLLLDLMDEVDLADIFGRDTGAIG